MNARCHIAVLALLCLSPARAGAQGAVVYIDAVPGCATCEVRLDTIAVVGSIADSVLMGDFVGGVAVTDGDTIVVGGGIFEGRTMVFGPNGDLVRTIGRLGEGPGEIQNQISVVPYMGRRILVPQQRRLSVMDLKGEVSVQRNAAYNYPSAFSAHPDGRVLYSYAQYGTETAGLRYEILGPDLAPIGAFGRIPAEEQLSCQRCRYRPSTWSLARPGYFWSVLRNRNQVELWSDNGQHALTLEITGAAWFEEWDADPPDPRLGSDGVVRPGAPRSTERPRPEFVGITEDEDGLLWVTARTVPDDWEPFPGEIPRTLNPSPEVREYLRRQWNTVIQVIDPNAGEIVATWTLENRWIQPIRDNHYYHRSQDDLGVISFTIMRARLVR